jgi:hypothetical protein
MNAQVRAETPPHRHPDTHPRTKPSQVPAAVLPAKPLINTLTATAAAKLRPVLTHIEHMRATNRVNSSIDRRLNWMGRLLGSGVLIIYVV